MEERVGQNFGVRVLNRNLGPDRDKFLNGVESSKP
jgi:hypothetical protein